MAVILENSRGIYSSSDRYLVPSSYDPFRDIRAFDLNTLFCILKTN